MLYSGLMNLHVVENANVSMTGGMDFSSFGIRSRFAEGYRMMDEHIARHGGDLSRPDVTSTEAVS